MSTKLFAHLICLALIKRDVFNFVFINTLIFVLQVMWFNMFMFFYVYNIFNKIILNKKTK